MLSTPVKLMKVGSVTVVSDDTLVFGAVTDDVDDVVAKTHVDHAYDARTAQQRQRVGGARTV